jgi:hypothetical protein
MSGMSKSPKMVVTPSGIASDEEVEAMNIEIPQAPIDALAEDALHALRKAVKSGLMPETAASILVQLATDYCRIMKGEHTILVLADLVLRRVGSDNALSLESVQ